MPVTKIPVVYKFGIVSSNKKLELQERLRKQSCVTSNNKDTKLLSPRNPIEVTEEFVQLFNSVISFKEKEKYEAKASELLERAKRRSGVRNCGQGSHVNLPLAWTEMAQLAQCKGRVQEESLNVLVTSLEVSSLERFHIPALFFLAETMLYWLRTEEVLDPFIRTKEIKLLKMGQLVFERLFYHHMTGQLQEYVDCKRRLRTYTDGLEELQCIYENFPNALLYLRFVMEVGKIILVDSQLINGGDTNSERPSPVVKQSEDETNLETKSIYEYYNNDEVRSSHSAALSSSVHDLSPTLWHALDVFRCTNSVSGGLEDALRTLDRCGSGLANETWIDGMVAIQILGESAKTNMAAMKVLHNLALGAGTAEKAVTIQPLNYGSDSSDLSIIHSERVDMDTSRHKYDKVFIMPPGNSEKSELYMSDHCELSRDNLNKQHTSNASDITDMKQILDPTMNDGNYVTDTDKKTDWKHKDSTTKNVDTERKSPCDQHQVPGIRGWHWEVAFVYTEVLENIVLYGNTASIQKHALVGFSDGNNNIHQHQHSNMNSAGLVDLAFFSLRNETNSRGLDPHDWSWKIRFGAMQSLMKICHSFKGYSIYEGLRTTAWNVFLKANAKEKDCLVLEALRAAKIHIDTKNLLNLSQKNLTTSLEKHIATRLSTIYLPPIPPPIVASARTKSISSPPVTNNVPPKPHEVKLLRTTIKQEIDLAAGLHEPTPDYYARKSFDLRRIVEDQWRKELQANLDQSEKEELQILKEKQQKEEERQRQIEASKQKKLIKKSSAVSGEEKEPTL